MQDRPSLLTLTLRKGVFVFTYTTILRLPSLSSVVWAPRRLDTNEARAKNSDVMSRAGCTIGTSLVLDFGDGGDAWNREARGACELLRRTTNENTRFHVDLRGNGSA